MKEQQITLYTAKFAQSKEFDIIVNSYPLKTFQIGEDSTLTGHTLPTQVTLQKWIREEHKIHIYITPTAGDKELYWNSQTSSTYHYNATYKSFMPNWAGVDLNSYEEALETGLIEALKLINKE